MPKLSQVLRDNRRKDLIQKHRAKRAELRKILRDPNASFEDKLAVHTTYGKLGRNSSSVRLKRRCRVTGRARGNYRKFGLSRIAMREMALRGELPGVRKASW
jgi:small subunit ribosomal protein S14